MRRRGLFLDTGVLLASVLEKDAHHAEATQILADDRWGRFHTSDHVLAEALNYARRKVRRPEVAERIVALAFGDESAAPLIDVVHRVHSGRFAAALERYRSEFERGLSFTDWASVVLIEEEGLDAIATFDGGFRGLVEVVG